MQSPYQQKKNRNKADFYGSWNNGVQIRPERIAGHTLTFNHHKHTWHGSATANGNS